MSTTSYGQQLGTNATATALPTSDGCQVLKNGNTTVPVRPKTVVVSQAILKGPKADGRRKMISGREFASIWAQFGNLIRVRMFDIIKVFFLKQSIAHVLQEGIFLGCIYFLPPRPRWCIVMW